VFNLLRGKVFLRLSRDPGRLRQELAGLSFLGTGGHRSLRSRRKGWCAVLNDSRDSVAIEVKASGAVAPRDLTGLRRLAEEVPLRSRIVVSYAI